MLALVFFVGLSVLCYPTFSDWWNSRTRSYAIASYQEAVADLTSKDYSEYFDAARDYNEKLRDVGMSAVMASPELLEGYDEILNINNSGVMGIITIEKIDVRLPIYHGTGAEVLQIAAGHLEGSSFPIGGEGTHSVISAHRGLPSSVLFTHLDRMKVGDIFTVTVLNEVLTYQVDQILVVLPTELESLAIEEGKDYCTLMTCTPYGINTHRLLVRGSRIFPEEESEEIAAVTEPSADERGELPEWVGWLKYLVGAVVLVLVLSEILTRIIRALRKK